MYRLRCFILALLGLPYESRCGKTGLRGFRPGPTQTGLFRIEAWTFVFKKDRNCSSYVAKTKALISFAVTAKLICVFVFAYAKSRFSHNEAHFISMVVKQQEHTSLSRTSKQ